MTYHPALAQHLRCTNDRNGNPRRGWAIYAADGTFLDFVDEGYIGEPRWVRDLPHLMTLEVSARKYRELLKMRATS